MNGCNAMQAKFSEYLDGRLTGQEMQRIAAHLDRCGSAPRNGRLCAMSVFLADAGTGPEARGPSPAHPRGRQPGACDAAARARSMP